MDPQPDCPPSRSADPVHRPRVLLVEDDGMMRRLMARALDRAGYDVVEAEDGIDLLGWVGSNMWTPDDAPLDAVVSDVNLPDLTALEVLTALRASDARIPIILVTAETDEAIRREAYALGVAAVLVKPFDVGVLGTMLTDLAQPARGKTC